MPRKFELGSEQQSPQILGSLNGEDPSPPTTSTAASASSPPQPPPPPTHAQLSAAEQAALDQEEADYRALSVDEDDPAPSIASLVVRIIKTPDKEQYFRTHPRFMLKLNLLQSRQGEAIDVAYLGVTKSMVEESGDAADLVPAVFDDQPAPGGAADTRAN